MQLIDVGVGDLQRATQLAFPLGRLLRQDVAHVRMAGFEPAIAFRAETLCSAALRLQLRHDFLLVFSPFQCCLDWAGGPPRQFVAAGKHLFVVTASRLALARTDHHDHLPSFHERLLLD